MSDPTQPAVPEPDSVPEPVEGHFDKLNDRASLNDRKPETISTGSRLADGEWHRLHPATPLLKGGIAFVAILGIVLVNLRDVFINAVFDGPEDFNPFVWIIEHDYAVLIILAIIGGLLLFIAGFYISWRMHTFRITDELVEVRSGVLFRTNRRGRLDRIQGINIIRPFLARLFGAAKLEINVAGQDANVQLDYLSSAAADELRREILLLASGTQAMAAAEAAQASGGIVTKRVNELLAPELSPDIAPPQSVLKMHPGRLIGSILLNESTVIMLVIGIGLVVTAVTTGEFLWIFGLIPGIIGIGGFYISRFTRSLRYSIAKTDDGIRVGFGLLSTSNETLPPGRIHAVQVRQQLLWRPAGWWQIVINRAANSSTNGASGQANTVILPVGNLADVHKVLELVLPGFVTEQNSVLISAGLTGKGVDGDGFVNSPRRAAILRWFSWRRNGFATAPGVTLLRKGAIWRELVLVPQARIQSIALSQGPLLRRVGVASVRFHTVAGPVYATLGAIDRDVAIRFFDDAAESAVLSAGTDTSHRWRASLIDSPVSPVVEARESVVEARESVVEARESVVEPVETPPAPPSGLDTTASAAYSTNGVALVEPPLPLVEPVETPTAPPPPPVSPSPERTE
ncbi:MAG: PH domain-containing protein [Rhodoglobus sp.]